MKKMIATAAGLLLITSMSACSADSEPPAAEPETEPTTVEVERNFDRNDACGLFTGEELAEAMGIADTGPLTATDFNIQDTREVHCDWAFTEAAIERLGIVTAILRYDAQMTMRLEAFQAPPRCFDMPCTTPAEYLAAWSADRYQWFTERSQTPELYEIVEQPDLLGGGVAVGPLGVIFLDEQIYLYTQIFACESVACAEGIIGIHEALAEKLG